jgi:Ca-activated chloride channel family protein
VSNTEMTRVFGPVAAETGKPVELAMQKLWLAGRILPVGARLLVRHTFRSAEKKPLEVIYSFGLPRDAALRRFRITGKGFSVSSDLKPVEKAVEAYEEGLAQGHLAAMAVRYGDGMVNLTVGNIRPEEEVAVNLEIMAGVETRDDGLRFRFPFTLAPAYHSRMRAAEVRPGVGEIELPADEFGDLVMPQFVSDPSALHEVGFDLTVAMSHPIVETGSPSHAVRVVGQGPNRSRVCLATAKDLPNRDLVLDIRTGESLAGVISGTGRDGRGYFAAVVPSAVFKDKTEGAEDAPRRVVFLLDRSGSMEGEPIAQARRAIEACLGALGEGDGFGLVAFDGDVEVFGSGLVEASKRNRERAAGFLAGIGARGGTELAAGINAAAKLLKKGSEGTGGGDILVVTDGQVMGTERIIGEARSTGIRIHCLGIGSASQDRFLSQIARETDGVSRFLTPRERVDLGAVELFASIARPLGTGLEAKVDGFEDGRVSPEPPASVFAGRPVVLFGDAGKAGEGRLMLAWDSDGKPHAREIPVAIGAGEEGETIRLIQGARLITDLETRYPAGGVGEGAATSGREAERVRKRLVALSETYGLASRAMALVAVVERAGDRPGDIPVTRIVPVGLAQDVMMGAYFERRLMLCDPGPGLDQSPAMLVCLDKVSLESRQPEARVKWSFPKLRRSGKAKIETGIPEIDDSAIQAGTPADTAQALLVGLAARLEPDGGMPGKDEEERVLATILALLKFLAEGHCADSGAFRVHVKRMVKFLKKSKIRNDVVEEIIERGRTGHALPGDWSKKKSEPALWAELERALRLDR